MHSAHFTLYQVEELVCCNICLYKIFFLVILICIHYQFTVKQKPKQLYIWTNYHLVDFYCSFHDDDETEIFKRKINGFVNLFVQEYTTSVAIRKHISHKDDTWFADTLISFCCTINDAMLDTDSYKTIMAVIAAKRKAEHNRQSSSKQSILRSSLYQHLGHQHSHTNRSLSRVLSAQPPSGPVTPVSTQRVLTRKWSTDSASSTATLQIPPGPSSFVSAIQGIHTLAEGDELEQYEVLDDHSKQTSHSSVHSHGDRVGFHHTIQIGMSPISQLNEEENEQQQTPHEGKGLLPLQSAVSELSMTDADADADEHGNLYRAVRQMTITPDSPQLIDEESEAHLEKMWTEREENDHDD